jgi:hypothetical protein
MAKGELCMAYKVRSRCTLGAVLKVRSMFIIINMGS